MSRFIQAFVILIQLAFASAAFCNQEKLDAERSQKLQAVFEAVQHADAAELASRLPGLSEEEAAKMLQEISRHWGDPGKLVKADGDPSDKLDKGRQKIAVHWGSGSTQIGRWLPMHSPASKKASMRIGLLFAKGSPDPRQFLADEWYALEIAPGDKPQGTKQ